MTAFEDCSEQPMYSVDLGHLQESVKLPFKNGGFFKENYYKLS